MKQRFRKSYADMTLDDWDGASRKGYPVISYWISDKGVIDEKYIASYPNMEIADAVGMGDFELRCQQLSNLFRKNMIAYNGKEHKIFVPYIPNLESK